MVRLWLAPVAALALAGLVQLAATRRLTLADIFLAEQDAIVLVLTFGLLVALRFIRAGGWAERLVNSTMPRFPGKSPLLLLGAFVLLAGAAGWRLVFHNYALSIDEFWASFDMQIFQRGALLAPIPQDWRGFAPALQPLWRMEVSGDTHWGSLYLPVNAAFRALFAKAGAEALINALWAALSCGLVYRIARTLWPGRRDAAIVASLLLATSSQLLITAMTPYAMSAHLALNLAWLALFLHDRPWSRIAAVGVGVLACGLHQLIFHPLFVAPFIVELLVARRWRVAAFYIAAYAVIGLGWTLYWTVSLSSVGAAPLQAQGVGAGFLIARLVDLLKMFDPAGVGAMAKNLLRFIAWQPPLMLPLALLAAPSAVRLKGPLRPLAWGLGLTTVAMFVLLPDQGLGWGYRYLHGLLGSMTLIATAGWLALTDAPGSATSARWRTALAATSAFALLVLFPIRAWQAARYVQPYAAASQAIKRSSADVVIVDATGLRYGTDLVRNAPFLENRPKVMDMHFLSEDQVRALCRTRTVALFDRRQTAGLGVPEFPEDRTAKDEATRALLDDAAVCPSVSAGVSPPRAATSS